MIEERRCRFRELFKNFIRYSIVQHPFCKFISNRLCRWYERGVFHSCEQLEAPCISVELVMSVENPLLGREVWRQSMNWRIVAFIACWDFTKHHKTESQLWPLRLWTWVRRKNCGKPLISHYLLRCSPYKILDVAMLRLRFDMARASKLVQNQ